MRVKAAVVGDMAEVWRPITRFLAAWDETPMLKSPSILLSYVIHLSGLLKVINYGDTTALRVLTIVFMAIG